MATTDLGKWMITNGGEYNPDTTYEQLTMVLYENSTYITLRTVTGITPNNDKINYILMAQGFSANALADVVAKDTYGAIGNVGESVSAQSLIDYLTNEVVNNLIKKTSISTVQVNSDDMVPSSSLSYSMQSAINDLNSNLGAELVTNDVLSYALGVGRGFYVIRTDNTTANTPKDYMSGYIFKRFVNPNQVTIVLFELGKTKPYYNSYNGSAWSGWVTGLQDSDFARESTDLNTAFNGIGAISMYNWSNATLHTPHKEGITVYGNGFAIGFDIGSFKVQVAFVVGENRIFIRSLRDGGAFSTWVAK